jgi:hypothetical protein
MASLPNKVTNFWILKFTELSQLFAFFAATLRALRPNLDAKIAKKRKARQGLISKQLAYPLKNCGWILPTKQQRQTLLHHKGK